MTAGVGTRPFAAFVAVNFAVAAANTAAELLALLFLNVLR